MNETSYILIIVWRRLIFTVHCVSTGRYTSCPISGWRRAVMLLFLLADEPVNHWACGRGAVMVGCSVDCLDCVDSGSAPSSVPTGDINGGVRVFSGTGLIDHYWGLHGELKLNMRFTSLMMYISPLLLVILYICHGFSDAAPRISNYDASPISRNPGSAPDTWETLQTDMPRPLPGSWFPPGPLTGLTASHNAAPVGPSDGSPVHETAASFQSTTESSSAGPGAGVLAAVREQISESISRLTQKRSTDAQAAFFAPEKMLQTMVSMVSQRSANDAWAADHTGTSITSMENSQGEYPPPPHPFYEMCVCACVCPWWILRSRVFAPHGGFDAESDWINQTATMAEPPDCMVHPFTSTRKKNPNPSLLDTASTHCPNVDFAVWPTLHCRGLVL